MLSVYTCTVPASAPWISTAAASRLSRNACSLAVGSSHVLTSWSLVVAKTSSWRVVCSARLSRCAFSRCVMSTKVTITPSIRSSDGAVRQHPHQVPAAVARLHLALDPVEPIEHALDIRAEVALDEQAADVGQRPPAIARQ